jgi:hypothetical protein
MNKNVGIDMTLYFSAISVPSSTSTYAQENHKKKKTRTASKDIN